MCSTLRSSTAEGLCAQPQARPKFLLPFASPLTAASACWLDAETLNLRCARDLNQERHLKRSVTHFEDWRRTASSILFSEPPCLIPMTSTKIIWNASSRNCPIKSRSLTAYIVNPMAVWGQSSWSAAADGSSINIARPSSAPPTLITPSSTICAADIAMPVTSKILYNLPAPKWTLIAHQIKFAGDQVEVTGQGVVECSQQVLCISTGLH